MTLSDIKDGQSVRVSHFTNLPQYLRKKLIVQGILPNTPIRVIRRAPFGDALQIEVLDVSLAMRKQFAQKIAVKEL